MERISRIWEIELQAVLEINKIGHRKRILHSVGATPPKNIPKSFEKLTAASIVSVDLIWMFLNGQFIFFSTFYCGWFWVMYILEYRILIYSLSFNEFIRMEPKPLHHKGHHCQYHHTTVTKMVWWWSTDQITEKTGKHLNHPFNSKKFWTRVNWTTWLNQHQILKYEDHLSYFWVFQLAYAHNGDIPLKFS